MCASERTKHPTHHFFYYFFFGWELQAFHIVSEDRVLPALLTFPAGLQDFSECRNSAYLLRPSHTCLCTHLKHSGLPPAFIQANRVLKIYDLLIQVDKTDFWSRWSYVMIVGLLIPSKVHVCSSMAEFLQIDPKPLRYYLDNRKSTCCCMYVFVSMWLLHVVSMGKTAECLRMAIFSAAGL